MLCMFVHACNMPVYANATPNVIYQQHLRQISV